MSFLLVHCGAGRICRGALAPQRSYPGTFSSFRTFSKNFTTHNPKSCSRGRRGTRLRNLPPPRSFQSDTSQIWQQPGHFQRFASKKNSAADDKASGFRLWLCLSMYFDECAQARAVT